MASAQMPEGLHVGTILWIKELAHVEDAESHDLPRKCFKHPCVVLNRSAPTRDIVQIYVITSKGERNINDLPLRAQSRGRYVPIRPKPINNVLPGVQLRLTGNIKLRKDSYVNSEKVYALPLSMLEPYDRKRPVTHFRLDSASIHWLSRKAFGEPLLSVQIQPSIAPATASILARSYDSFRSLPQNTVVRQNSIVPQYSAVLPYNARTQQAILPQHAILPSQTVIPSRPLNHQTHHYHHQSSSNNNNSSNNSNSNSNSNSNNNSNSNSNNDNNMTEPMILTSATLTLLGTIALLLFIFIFFLGIPL